MAIVVKIRYYRLVYVAILACVAVSLFCCSSPKKQKVKELAYRQELENSLEKINNEDSLRILLYQFTEEKNDYGVMLCHYYLGLYMRENTRFLEAIDYHQEGLSVALGMKDTIGIMQAYNALGTDFRRIGAQGEASEYHYKALEYAESYSQVNEPGVGMKSRVVSLNGIGNVYLTLGYLDDAERYFRLALNDEIQLESLVGQAINYANLGDIFEMRGQLDSARVYYEKSLEQNQKDNSNKGVGLCLIHFGDLYLKEKKYIQAREKYLKAYDLLGYVSDKRYQLQACLSIARMGLLENDIAESSRYIALAEELARNITAPEFMADLYLLKHENDIEKGDYKQALHNYKMYTQMEDSINNTQKTNRVMDVRVNYERHKNERQILRMEIESASRESRRKLVSNILISVVLVVFGVLGLLYYAYQQRNKSNKMLRELERARTDFYTNITHEFRTPLTVIQGFSRLLQDKNEMTEKEKNKYFDAINRQTGNMLNLVNQLLDVTKLRSGKDEPVWRHGDIISYLRMTAETFKLYAERKNIELVFHSDMTELEMDFIPFYIDKLVSNLLSNAVKHTQAGDRIDFVAEKGKRPDTIIVRVMDTGEGIPKEDLERIFELFYQSDNARNTAGSGIGLAFTRMIVEKMKGEIKVDSELGKGTTFAVTLPVKNKKLQNIAPLQEDISVGLHEPDMVDIPKDEFNEEEIENGDADGGKPIVLVVEDNKDVRHYITTLLNDKYCVIAASNGQEGLEMAEEYIPDLVVTDLMMPLKDGACLCVEMKRNMMLNHIPVIMITAKSDDEDRIKGLQCGAEAYIKKPFHHEELFACIHNLLEGRNRIIEKYKDTLENNLSGTNSKVDSDANLKYLQTVTDIIVSEMQNPNLNTVFIAEKMFVGPSQLNRKLNGIVGQSTVSYILKVKLNTAKKMLQNTSNSIADVSYTCGFNDASYFSRVFKKEFGITPSQYQRIPG